MLFCFYTEFVDFVTNVTLFEEIVQLNLLYILSFFCLKALNYNTEESFWINIVSLNAFSMLNILCVINTVNTDQSAALKTAGSIKIAMPRLLPRFCINFC